MNHKVQPRLKPKGLSGISDDQITQHWKLYEGYVKNANRLLEDVARAEAGSPAWAELKRRLGFEIDGVVLHEYYVGSLAKGSKLGTGGSGETWREDFARTGAIRGVGWWVSSHEQGHPAGFHPRIGLDVFEHAYLVDHGAGGREKYPAAFLENVNWEVVEQRYQESRAGRFTARF